MMIESPGYPQSKLDVNQLHIRRMRDRDVPEIMTIESVSFGRHHWAEESFLNEMRNQMGRYYSLIDNSQSQTRLIGYCGFWIIFEEAHITTVAVKPELRGNSLGEILLVHMLDRCMGQTIHWVTLEVRATNYSAQNLYYKYGLQVAGLRPKYYQDNNEDALIMTTPDILTPDYRATFRKLKDGLRQKLGGLPEGLGQ
jgi:ribosomal-protein-alanine N-acetyltransferase